MTKDNFAVVMDRVFNECLSLRSAGQKEYAGGEDAFGNFNRLAASLNIDRKKILMVYLMKHIDAIFSYINGHKSQRESVYGRINDAIVYLTLLAGMVDEDSGVSDATSVPIGLPRIDAGIASNLPNSNG